MLLEGFATTITGSEIPGIKLFEKEITPPGVSKGGAIDVTNMRNTAWRTAVPRKLKTLPELTVTVAYAMDAYKSVLEQKVGVNQEFTVTFPDNATLKFWGWIEEFTPAAMREGEQPTATLRIVPSNRNATGVETGPVVTLPSP